MYLVGFIKFTQENQSGAQMLKSLWKNVKIKERKRLKEEYFMKKEIAKKKDEIKADKKPNVIIYMRMGRKEKDD